jgi:hypothetical protein
MKSMCFALVVASVGICFAQSGEIRTAGSGVVEAGGIGLVIASAPVTDPFAAAVVTGKPFIATPSPRPTKPLLTVVILRTSRARPWRATIVAEPTESSFSLQLQAVNKGRLFSSAILLRK